MGDAEIADLMSARAGRSDGEASGLILGTPVDWVRCDVARAIWVVGLAACTFRDCWLRAAPGLLVACRATVAEEGRGWSLGAPVGAWFAATSAVTVVALGSVVADSRRARDEIGD